MTSGKFLRTFAITSLSIIAGIILINVAIDIFGLFRGRDHLKVYTNDRTSKFLLTYRYVPENFNGFIIGPSLSANLNPAAITSYKVYNASIMGANISDLHNLINNMVDRGDMKIAIFCLDPYLTKDFGPKASSINEKEYYGALGSTNLLRTYTMYTVRESGLFKGKVADEVSDENGWTNFGQEMDNIDPKRAIEEKVKLKEKSDLHIDDRALEELGQVLAQLRAKNIQVVGYFSPVPREIYELGREDYREFERRMSGLFTDKDILFNLNEDKYKEVTSDYNTYIDHGHLSASGQAFVLSEINAHIAGL